MGKWNLVKDAMAYEHSSARYYISGRHAGYEVVDVEKIIQEKLTLEPDPIVIGSLAVSNEKNR